MYVNEYPRMTKPTVYVLDGDYCQDNYIDDLGKGASVTDAAAEPVSLSPQSEYRPTEYMQPGPGTANCCKR